MGRLGSIPSGTHLGIWTPTRMGESHGWSSRHISGRPQRSGLTSTFSWSSVLTTENTCRAASPAGERTSRRQLWVVCFQSVCRAFEGCAMEFALVEFEPKVLSLPDSRVHWLRERKGVLAFR